eukprot:CAMPEP_0114553282 /NCGR_PEP_ID=MMETSP0114-20121206/7570_1 /TAXON_ID=31324 /ORGANISM="Goniomonas sp, Strain m" /LENGTH=656 /DNA_ID=CAMNT_0001738205 /DNA_START=8 /DNA_END=1978 /DNA_ORIENTATION=+
MAQKSEALQFQTFTSTADVSFWGELARLKLEVYRLTNEVRPIMGTYSLGSGVSRMCFGREAFEQFTPAPHTFAARGNLNLFETLDDFKGCDKKEFLKRSGEKLWESIRSGAAVEDPTLLLPFELLIYADLKHFVFYYWFAFPTLLPSSPVTSDPPQPLHSVLSAAQASSFQSTMATGATGGVGFFTVTVTGDDSVKVGPLKDWEADTGAAPKFLAIADPSSLSAHPGWPLRSLLFLAAYRWKLSEVAVICYRGANSIVLRCRLGPQPDSDAPPGVSGWEQNAKGKLGARKVDLSPVLDPQRMAESAADLNLKLMRWRFLPELDLERISNARCLILGSGTLGCNIARSLMSWGFRKLDLVDQGRVSYSNPTRQWLFDFKDCAQGTHKAVAACQRLKEIFPAMEATPHDLSIPMPGHPVAPSGLDICRANVAKLEALIDAADLVFLLTDTRESRWLPTVMCATKRKTMINAALGFDSFMVLRHGIAPEGGAPDGSVGAPHLGCYFCNDIVAPVDSTKGRAMDQQCTVTRPGLSAIASAMAVELAVSLLHHPQGASAPADLALTVGEPTVEALGIVPHMVRGYLAYFQNVIVQGPSFGLCTGCSSKVTTGYRDGGFEFLLKCFNEAEFLENLTGLTEMRQGTDDIDVDWDEDDDEMDEM